jgi:hypothetical protein
MRKEDPIYSYEARDQIELNLSQWKTAYNMWERAAFQNAPPELVDKLKEIVECYQDASVLLDQIKGCFPPEPTN